MCARNCTYQLLLALCLLLLVGVSQQQSPIEISALKDIAASLRLPLDENNVCGSQWVICLQNIVRELRIYNTEGEMPQAIEDLVNLNSIIMINVTLEGDMFPYLKEVDKLRKLEFVTSTIENLRNMAILEKLESLIFNSMDLKNLEPYMKLTTLKTLKIFNDNTVKEVPSTIVDLVNLTSLAIKGTLIERLPDTYVELSKHLGAVDLQNNCIMECFQDDLGDNVGCSINGNPFRYITGDATCDSKRCNNEIDYFEPKCYTRVHPTDAGRVDCDDDKCTYNSNFRFTDETRRVGTHLFIKNNVRARLRHSQGHLEVLKNSTIEFGPGASILLDYSSRVDYDPWVNKIKSIPSYREIIVKGTIVGELPPVRVDKPASVCDDIQVTTFLMSKDLYASYKIVPRECEPESDENDDDAASGGGETSSSLGHVREMSLIGLFIMGVMLWMN